MAKKEKDIEATPFGVDTPAVKDTVATKPAEPAPEEASTEGLVKMHKHGETVHVHPTTVESHKSAGWELA